MHFLVALVALAAVTIVGANPVDSVWARSPSKSTTTTTTTKVSRSSSFVPLHPYTASLCVVTPTPTPAAAFHCGTTGQVMNPAPLLSAFNTKSYIDCADFCQCNSTCISFGWDKSSTACTMYALPLTNMDFAMNRTSTVKFANRHCFGCSKTTTTIVISATPDAVSFLRGFTFTMTAPLQTTLETTLSRVTTTTAASDSTVTPPTT